MTHRFLSPVSDPPRIALPLPRVGSTHATLLHNSSPEPQRARIRARQCKRKCACIEAQSHTASRPSVLTTLPHAECAAA
eukprot:4898277-Pleurochrysis_carterae.AAC.5